MNDKRMNDEWEIMLILKDVHIRCSTVDKKPDNFWSMNSNTLLKSFNLIRVLL